MTKEEVISIAAKWWTDKLASITRHDNGDNSRTSLVACLFADMCSEPITKEQLVIFEEELIKNIRNIYEEHIEHHNMRYTVIGCDYGPCGELYSAAEKAGINHGNFPFKTWMRIGPDYVEVSAGYGRPYERI